MNLTVRELIEKLQWIAEQGGENDTVVIGLEGLNVDRVEWDRTRNTPRTVSIR